GDKAALQVWRNAGAHLGRAVANAVLLLNPKRVVLCGGVSRAAKYFLPAVKSVLKTQSVKTPFKNLKIIISKEDNAGGAGAALYALSKTNEI
ncbi:MAG: ROK family protein, partial [Elusimicrobiota bacterium]|nr:ROK family protein [Elusimicrobiota bacterium]